MTNQMEEILKVSIDGNMAEVYLISQKGLVKVMGSGIIPDRKYFATLSHIRSITKRQLILAYPDNEVKIDEY